MFLVNYITKQHYETKVNFLVNYNTEEHYETKVE